MKIRVVIADDHPLVLDGLRMAIARSGKDIVIDAEAADGKEVLQLARTNPADVFILDIMMPGLNGIETTRELLKMLPDAKVIVLSLHDTKLMVEAALEAGARGYLTKEMASRTVAEAVTEVHAGRYYLCPQAARWVVEAHLTGAKRTRPRGGGAAGAAGAAVAAALTGQETQTLQLIAEGRSNKEIASVMGLSINTVHSHRNSVMAKLNIHRQADLVRYAIKAGITKL